MMPKTPAKLTEYEWNGLRTTFNLADGHPRQPLSLKQKLALKDISSMLLCAQEGHELRAKHQFEEEFFKLARQAAVHTLNPPLSQYSGSSAIELIANYLRVHKKSVAFLQPSFDSIADTLKRHDVPLFPLSERQLSSLTPTSARLPIDVLYIVAPNNPTGRSLTKTQFKNIVAYCKKYQLLLVIDFCFRFYGDLWKYDQYEILQSSDIDFITTEDTGKSWPTADIKLGMVLSSDSLYPSLKTISDDFLLSVSPFIFALLCKYITSEDLSSQRIASQDIIDTNRRTLKELLKGSPIKSASHNPSMSVEWLQLPKNWKAADFTQYMAHHGVQVLPGEQFYWHNQAHGERYFRIALLREETYFRKAMIHIQNIVSTYHPNS